MLSALSRLPLDNRAPVAKWLLSAAGLLAVGAALALTSFLDDTETSTSGILWWQQTSTTTRTLGQRVPSLLLCVALVVVAIACTVVAIQLYLSAGQLQTYPPILTGVESMPIQRVAEITGRSRSQVIRDIQSLVDSGAMTDVYIDYAADAVVSKAYLPKVSRKSVVVCQNCGGASEVIVGIPRPCGFCGAVLGAPG